MRALERRQDVAPRRGGDRISSDSFRFVSTFCPVPSHSVASVVVVECGSLVARQVARLDFRVRNKPSPLGPFKSFFFLIQTKRCIQGTDESISVTHTLSLMKKHEHEGSSVLKSMLQSAREPAQTSCQRRLLITAAGVRKKTR